MTENSNRMTKVLIRFWRLARGSLCGLLAGFIISLPLATYGAASSTGEPEATSTVQFGTFRHYDYGVRESIAVHPSGLVLSFHEAADNNRIWYRVGQFAKSIVYWSDRQDSGANGYHPTVAISKEGYVIVVHSNKMGNNGTDLYYQVGKLNPYGGWNQSVTWLTDFIHWDAGFNSSIAINDSGVIIGVHEAGRGGDGLYYRVGHLRAPAHGDYTIQWDSTQWGVRYETGINPSIALNNLNQVVEVHQVPGEYLLHYRRGSVNGGAINFGGSRRYDDFGNRPAVALLDSGLVLEFNALHGLSFRTGSLSLSDSENIYWALPVELDDYQNIDCAAVAAAGTFAIATYLRDNRASGDIPKQLSYSFATIAGEAAPQINEIEG